MGSLRDRLGKGDNERSPLSRIEVEIDTICDKCFAPGEKVYYNRDEKTLTSVCIHGHVTEIEGNWFWLIQ